jgi:excisionase family DNA binding protein
MLRCAPRTVRRLVQFGRMPRPLKVGRLARWRRSDVERWIADGCPACGSEVGDGADTIGGGGMGKNHNGIGTAPGNGLTGSDREGPTAW